MCKSKKVRVTRTGTRLLRVLIGVVSLSFMSCKMSSTIKVHQNQGNDSTQIQDVEIKHEGMLNSLALSFVF